MVIVGAGECGARAALALREEGYDGPVTLIGAEAHLPYERPPLSKEALCCAEHPRPKDVATEQRLADAGVTLLRSTQALSIDRDRRTVSLSTGNELGYDRLLLATGASPRRLPLAEHSGRCVYLRTYDDALAIRSRLHAGIRLAVIGGGFIGLEVAASARTLGCEVTVIEAQPRILMRGVPEEIASVVHAEHERRGTKFKVGQAIAAIADGSDTVRIELAAGESVDADLCLVGIGAVPNTDLAAAAGLAIDNGIAVDAGLRTSDPHIFAAGDCCSFPLALYDGRRVRLEAWRNAQEQGALAARNMLGADERTQPFPGSGRISSNSACRSPGCRTRPSRSFDATSTREPSSCSDWRPLDGLSRRAASDPAMRSPRTSGSPKC